MSKSNTTKTTQKAVEPEQGSTATVAAQGAPQVESPETTTNHEEVEATNLQDPATTNLQEPINRLTVVIGVFTGTLQTVKKAFEALAEQVNVVYIESPSEDIDISDLTTLSALALSRDDIPDTFVLIPPGTIQCGDPDIASLQLATVYITKAAERQYYSRLPMVMNKQLVMELLQREDITEAENPNEEFSKAVIAYMAERPVEVSFSFGNYITPVLRANPCEHIVIEALLKKKFITSTEEGFKAIIPLLDKAKK